MTVSRWYWFELADLRKREKQADTRLRTGLEEMLAMQMLGDLLYLGQIVWACAAS